MASTRFLRSIREAVVGGAAAVSALLASPVIRRWYNRWGATTDEADEKMPGDELVERPRLGYTRAITIDAPPESVWPWLAQFGQGRGGFYSYDGLENLVGCQIHSVDDILPEHQDPEPGDLIRSGPADRYAAWEVLQVDPPHHLVLMGADSRTGKAPPAMSEIPDRGYAASTWQWRLRPEGSRSTRLVVRQRLAYSARQHLLWRIVEPLNFVMERKMLLGLRKRAESAAANES